MPRHSGFELVDGEHIIPETDNASDLGSSSKRFAEVHAVDAGFSGALKTDNLNEYTTGSGVAVENVLIKDGKVDGKDVSELTRYVVRDTNAWDFTESDFPTTDWWVTDGLDLSSIVPSGARAVDLLVHIRSSSALGKFSLRRNSSYQLNIADWFAQVLGRTYSSVQRIAIDPDRKLDYWRDSEADYVRLAVVGWVV